MKQEQIDAVHALGEQGEQFGPLGRTVFESAFFIHGHICGGMPLGFRAGTLALKTLGIERELNMAHMVVVETGTGHAAGCFADGVQMSTGCTFGKGLIRRAEYGKWALNLVERESGRAVRVSVLPQVMEAAFASPFVKMRHEGVAPTEVPLDVSKALVENLLAKPDDELFVASGVFDYPLPPTTPANFNLVRCSACGEAVAENKVRLKETRPFCLPCSGYSG